eukprot:86846_1
MLSFPTGICRKSNHPVDQSIASLDNMLKMNKFEAMEARTNKTFYGYIHQFENQFNISIPSIICRICYLFYNLSLFQWSITTKQLFINSNKSKLFSPQFDVLTWNLPQNIKLQLILSNFNDTIVCGRNINNEFRQINIALKMIQFPNKINHAVIMVILKCNDISLEYRNICNFKKQSNESQLLTKALISENEMPEKLHFTLYINVLYVVFAQYITDTKLICENPRRMNSVFEFEWNIDNDIIEQFKKTKVYSEVYSDIFGSDGWCFSIKECGRNIQNKGNLMINLMLLRLPFGVKGIEISYQLAPNFVLNDNGNTKYDCLLSYDNNYCSQMFELPNNLTEWFLHGYNYNNNPMIKVYIQIKNVLLINGNNVNEKLWRNYGIVCNAKKHQKLVQIVNTVDTRIVKKKNSVVKKKKTLKIKLKMKFKSSKS